VVGFEPRPKPNFFLYHAYLCKGTAIEITVQIPSATLFFAYFVVPLPSRF
jgi:hypothetical protein